MKIVVIYFGDNFLLVLETVIILFQGDVKYVLYCVNVGSV